MMKRIYQKEYHLKAYLSKKRNVRQGLIVRTRISSKLDDGPSTASQLSNKINLKYSLIMYHLHLMETEHIVRKTAGRPFFWELTGAGQKGLLEK
ncbi:MAG: hypothetical protein QW279_11830 [Candidatus Jordarchaeaceae archaeon]